jgi:hypothetical protein
MSDVNIIDSGMAKKGLTPFEGEPAAPLPSATELVGTPLEDRIADSISGDSDEAKIRASVDALNEKRRKDWESGVGPDIFEEQNAPVLERKYDGRDKSAKSLREATKDLSDQHRLEKPDAKMALEYFGGKADEVLERAKSQEFAEAYGLTPDEARIWNRTGELPPHRVGLATDKGIREKLRDDQPITDRPAHEALNVRQATREQKAFREFEAAELARQALADQEAINLGLQQQSTGQTTVEQSAPVAATEQTQQPDPVAQERAQLAVAQQYYAIATRATEDEQKAAAAIKYFTSTFEQQFPESRNPAAIEETRQRNPARFQAMQAAAANVAAGVDGWMRYGANATAQREQVERAVAQHQQAQVRAAWHQYKDAQDALAQRHIPELSGDPAKAAVLRNETKAMLRERGFDEKELAHVWDGHGGVSIRDARVQAVIADAARWRMAQAAAKNRNAYKELPLVQRPGTARPRGADSEADIARLQRELETATGDKAVRLGTRLHQLQRRGA